MDKAEKAAACFRDGCNCSQAVLTAFCEEYGMDRKLALKTACSFGGGMGHTGQVCGAVSGALLVLGLKYGPDNAADQQSKTRNYRIVKDFVNRFKALNSSTNCTELIGYDLSDDAQLTLARQADVFKMKCGRYVSDAVRLLTEMIAEYDKA